MNALKLIMMLVVCNESFRITGNLLELIVATQLAASCHIEWLKGCVLCLFESWCHYDCDHRAL